MTTAAEQIHRLGTVLAGCARVVAAERAVMADPTVYAIAADLTDLLHVLICPGRDTATVDELVAGHISDIGALMRQLPRIDETPMTPHLVEPAQ